jgi:glycosyltransferase involved in cell wall biosynthesis
MIPKPTLRVLVATGIFPPSVGGPATYSRLLLEELPRCGIATGVLSFDEVRHLPKGLSHLVYFWRLLKCLGDYDLVYAQDPVSVGFPAWLAAKLRRRKFMIRVAGDYAWEQGCQRFGIRDSVDDFQGRRYGGQTEFLRRLQTFVVKRAAAVITPSQYFRGIVIGWGVSPERVSAIYNGIDLAEAPTPDPESWETRPRVLISAGRLVPWKGFGGLLRLLAVLPQWRLEIVGSGPEQSRLLDQARLLGVIERVNFAGALPRAELFRRLAAAKIFILNSAFESFSFQVVEALAAGVPVITTAVGSLPELVTDRREGLLVAPDDLEAMGEAIKFLENHPEISQRFVVAGRRKAETFAIKKTVDQLVEILNAL